MLAANCPPHTAQPLAHAFSLSVSGTCQIGRCSPWATPFPPPPPPKVAPLCSAASSVLLRGPTPPERSYPPCGFRLRGAVWTQLGPRRPGGLPALVHEASRRVWGLCLRRTDRRLAPSAFGHVAFRQI